MADWAETLETERCLLAKPQSEDSEHLKSLYTNPEVRKYLGGPVAESEIDARVAAVIHSERELPYWVVKRAYDGEFVGSISMDRYHDGTNIEVSYQLLPEWWGQGYGSEVVRRVIKYAFAELHFAKVIAETQTANRSSCRLLEKLGMRLDHITERFGAEQAVFLCIKAGR